MKLTTGRLKKNRHAGNPSIPDVAVSSNVKRRSVRRARTSDACARDRPAPPGLPTARLRGVAWTDSLYPSLSSARERAR